MQWFHGSLTILNDLSLVVADYFLLRNSVLNNCKCLQLDSTLTQFSSCSMIHVTGVNLSSYMYPTFFIMRLPYWYVVHSYCLPCSCYTCCSFDPFLVVFHLCRVPVKTVLHITHFNSYITTEQPFVKFDIGRIYKKIVKPLQFSCRMDSFNYLFAWRHMSDMNACLSTSHSCTCVFIPTLCMHIHICFVHVLICMLCTLAYFLSCSTLVLLLWYSKP